MLESIRELLPGMVITNNNDSTILEEIEKAQILYTQTNADFGHTAPPLDTGYNCTNKSEEIRRNIHLKHVGTKTIETKRLTLRKLELTDAEMMFRNWTCDDKVTRFLRWDAHKTIDDTNSMIQQWVDNYQDDSAYYWGMYLKNGEMIGSIGITIISEYDLKGELGYKIGSRWWNQGYSSEAARAVIDYMFRNTDIERIDAFSSVANPASRKVMEKIGMHYVGLLRHYYKTRDGFHDCTLYEIIRDEWD